MKYTLVKKDRLTPKLRRIHNRIIAVAKANKLMDYEINTLSNTIARMNENIQQLEAESKVLRNAYNQGIDEYLKYVQLFENELKYTTNENLININGDHIISNRLQPAQ